MIAFNTSAESIRKEKRLERMARAMGLASPADIGPALKDMSQRLGLPTGLAAMGVQESQYEAIIDGAMADHCHKTNPRLATREDYRAMLLQSM